jgi:hypothetical protein
MDQIFILGRVRRGDETESTNAPAHRRPLKPVSATTLRVAGSTQRLSRSTCVSPILTLVVGTDDLAALLGGHRQLLDQNVFVGRMPPVWPRGRRGTGFSSGIQFGRRAEQPVL